MSKFPYQLSLDAAYMLRANLFDGVMRCEIVGALRRIESYIEATRESFDVEMSGIELIAIPNIGRVRHTKQSDHNFLVERMEVLGYPANWQDGFVTFYAPLPNEAGWIPAKLWLTTMENFGADYFIRTGTDEAVKRVLRPEAEGGWLKKHMRFDGQLWEGKERVVCLTESTFMQNAFERKMILPHLRSKMGIEDAPPIRD